MSSGFFICIEGISGVGKTTQAEVLKKRINFFFQREVVLAHSIDSRMKQIVTKFFTDLGINNTGLVHDSMSMSFIFLSLFARQHDIISEALTQGKIVIADRWATTFHAYNSIVGPLRSDKHQRDRECLASLAFRSLQPDVTFFLDLSPRTAIERFEQRKRSYSYKTLDVETWENIRSGFFKKADPLLNWHVLQVDGKTVETINEEIWAVLFRFPFFASKTAIIYSLKAQFRDAQLQLAFLPPTLIPPNYPYKVLSEISIFRNIKHECVTINYLGGWSNLTFRLSIGEQDFVVRATRVGALKLKQCMQKSFVYEYGNSMAASQLGFCPLVRYFNFNTGTNVTDYVGNSKSLKKEDFLDLNILEKCVLFLQSLHRSKLHFNNTVNIFSEIIHMADWLQTNPEHLFPHFDQIMQYVYKLKSQFHEKQLSIPLVPCHNDANPNNFLLLKSNELQLVDWEFSGYNDPAWDLACLSSLAEFTFKQDSVMLTVYNPLQSDKSLGERFLIYKALFPLWGALCLRFLALHGDNLTDQSTLMTISETQYKKSLEQLPLLTEHF